MAPSAPPNANAGSNRLDAACAPMLIAITAPRAPPDETPMIPGSASGLRKRDCIVAPAVPSAAPTAIANTIRGSRIRSITTCSVSVADESTSPTTSSKAESECASEMSSGPTDAANITSASSNRPRPATPARSLRGTERPLAAPA